MKPAKIVIALGALLALLVGGALALTGPGLPAGARSEPALPSPGSAALDGLVFEGELGIVGKPADVKDRLVFANGMFLSEECERRCGYPASPYYVREGDGVIEFVSESRCPGKNATLAWKGSIRDGAIEGRFLWTSERWYWTFEKEFRFQGALVERTASADRR